MHTANERAIRRAARARLEKMRAKRAPVESEAVKLARTDFIRFCGLVEIVPKTGGRVPLYLNPIQMLFHINRSGRDVILKPRQIGFTTLELARDLWTFLCKEGSRVVVVCQSTTDNAPAKLISGVLSIMIEGLRKHGWAPKFKTEAWNEWVLENGNSLRIVVAGASEDAAAKKGRAGTITRLHLTETAFYEFAKQTLNALLECVPGRDSGSEIVSESTANGAAGEFYKACKDAQAGRSAYRFHFFPWFGHPEYRSRLLPGETIVPQDEDEHALVKEHGVTPEQLKWRREKIADKGIDDFNQEYPNDPESCFLVSGSSFFDKKATAKNLAATADVKPLETRDNGRIRIYRKPDYTRREKYILSLDPAEGGGGGDPAGGVMYDKATGEHVLTIDGQYTPYQLAEVGAKLAKEYSRALVAVERNNHGFAVIQALLSPPNDSRNPDPVLYGNLYVHDDDKPGFPTNAATRPEILDDLQDAHLKGIWKSPDHGLHTQMRTFVMVNGKPQASAGEHDDLVIAAAIGWAVRQRSWVGMDTIEEALTLQMPAASTFGLHGRGF